MYSAVRYDGGFVAFFFFSDGQLRHCSLATNRLPIEMRFHNRYYYSTVKEFSVYPSRSLMILVSVSRGGSSKGTAGLQPARILLFCGRFRLVFCLFLLMDSDV